MLNRDLGPASIFFSTYLLTISSNVVSDIASMSRSQVFELVRNTNQFNSIFPRKKGLLKQKQRKPLDEKGDSVESSCHQRPACLRASSQQSNADTMTPTGLPFSSRKNLGPRGPKNKVTKTCRKMFSWFFFH